jgi:glycosyltransferase involved in cell wall biosynthesis
MRAAVVCADPGVPVFGSKGASVHVQAIAGALSRAGAQVDLLATRTGGDPPMNLARVRLHALPAVPKGDAGRREAVALAHNDALAAALQTLGPLDLVYERYSLWSHAGMEYARGAGVPGLLEVNAPLIDEQAWHRTLVDRPGAEAVAARAFGAATAIVAVSDGVKGWLAGWPEARGKVHVVANGVDPARFSSISRRERPGRAGRFTVGFLGTLKPWHGLDTLVAAFARLHARRPGVRLLVVGDGPEAPRIAAELEERALREAVRLTGAVDPADVPRHLAEMDVAVAPYPDLRPFYFSPLKIVEYQAAGLPVVCSDVGGLDRLVADEVTGLLCPPSDPTALAAALEGLAADPRRCERLGQAARERVLATHTWDAVARRVLDFAGLRSPARRAA